MSTCTEVRSNPFWYLDGHLCACERLAVHVFHDSRDDWGIDVRAHRCGCGTWWYDIEQLTRAGSA